MIVDPASASGHCPSGLALLGVQSSPIGTMLTVTYSGLGASLYEGGGSLLYDNKYTGLISAVTTQGTAVFQIRASGRPGRHVLQLNNSTASAPGAYLNTQQSPQDYIYAHLDNKQEFRFTPMASKRPASSRFG